MPKAFIMCHLSARRFLVIIRLREGHSGLAGHRSCRSDRATTTTFPVTELVEVTIEVVTWTLWKSRKSFGHGHFGCLMSLSNRGDWGSRLYGMSDLHPFTLSRLFQGIYFCNSVAHKSINGLFRRQICREVAVVWNSTSWLAVYYKIFCVQFCHPHSNLVRRISAQRWGQRFVTVRRMPVYFFEPHVVMRTAMRISDYLRFRTNFMRISENVMIALDSLWRFLCHKSSKLRNCL